MEAAPPTQKLKLVIAYDGTGYAGWQVQKIGTGVQEKVEAALAALFPSRPVLHSSSRTDTGVHALALVAHFEVPLPEWRMPVRRLLLAVNAHLPEDIRVMAARCVPPGFHARFDATGKEYRYRVWNHPAANPLLRTQAWHLPWQLDLAAMRHAAAALEGRHDFRAFTANPGYERRSTVRTLHRVAVQRQGPLLTFVIRGDGFLYKMCRGLVGTLIQIGGGRLPPDCIPAILASGDRSFAGMTAPACGLVLWRVFYRRRGGPPPERPAAAED